jgi:hypothetical protein
MLPAMLPYRLFAVLGLTAFAAACAPTMGPPPPGPLPNGSTSFSAEDFAWSKRSGANAISGLVAYRQGPMRFSCAGSSVVLTPETTWSRRRVAVLYGSTERAALPADEVRARTPSAPAGDVGPFVKRTTCDESGRFTIGGLPDGGWFVITIAKPMGQPQGASIALMRRVVTRGGKPLTVAL